MPFSLAVLLVPAALICGLKAYKGGQRSMAYASVALGAIGVIGIAYTHRAFSEVVRDPFSARLSQSPPLVSKSDYDRIEEGMSYAQTSKIIGAPGEELSRSDLAGYRTVMYSWKNSNGSNMNAMFQNDRLVTKAQFGLR